MKFNKWTLGLAAIGVVSLASAAQAEEKMGAVQTALSSTTISGYVDVSAHWNLGTGNAVLPPYKFNTWGDRYGVSKADGFNLNVVQLSISKPLDESEWASGYKVDLWFGPDANNYYIRGLGTSSEGWSEQDFAIRQAYVALRTPVGNGIEWKVGVFDTILGYESVESGNNPNYTRSYGCTIEPQTHTGVLATYRFTDWLSAAVGVANTVGPVINARAFSSYDYNYSDDEDWKAESYKTYMGSIALTAPENWGWAAGSTLYAGVVNGFNNPDDDSAGGENTTSWYAGATLATPVTGLKFGAAFDYLDVHNCDANVWAVAGYASYQATEKLSLHVRGEYVECKDIGLGSDYYYDYGFDDAKIFALTGTIQYDLWKNVISRLEVRWDHSANGEEMFGGEYKYDDGDQLSGLQKNAVLIAANIIYKF